MTRPNGSVRYNNQGRVILVTGGANGIGRAICEGWVSTGASVVCMDVDDTAAESLPEGIDFVKGPVADKQPKKATVLQHQVDLHDQN
ncbi:MAG: SDR family NAD(P)-dependent oxidoreductase [Planctomycetaceae bacterium]